MNLRKNSVVSVYHYNYQGGHLHLHLKSEIGVGKLDIGYVLIREILCPPGYFAAQLPSLICKRCRSGCVVCNAQGECQTKPMRMLDETRKGLTYEINEFFGSRKGSKTSVNPEDNTIKFDYGVNGYQEFQQKYPKQLA